MVSNKHEDKLSHSTTTGNFITRGWPSTLQDLSTWNVWDAKVALWLRGKKWVWRQISNYSQPQYYMASSALGYLMTHYWLQRLLSIKWDNIIILYSELEMTKNGVVTISMVLFLVFIWTDGWQLYQPNWICSSLSGSWCNSEAKHLLHIALTNYCLTNLPSFKVVWT